MSVAQSNDIMAQSNRVWARVKIVTYLDHESPVVAIVHLHFTDRSDVAAEG